MNTRKQALRAAIERMARTPVLQTAVGNFILVGEVFLPAATERRTPIKRAELRHDAFDLDVIEKPFCDLLPHERAQVENLTTQTTEEDEQ